MPAATTRSHAGAPPRRRVAPGPGKYDRSQSPAERRAEQRGRLIRAAGEVFAVRGFSGASVDQIIRKVRMSRRTFYVHFDDLQDVLIAVYDDAASQLFERVETAVRAETDPLCKVVVGIESYLEAMQALAPLARILCHEILALGPRHAARQEATRSRFVTLWIEGLSEAHAAGATSRAPDELMVYGLVSACEAVALRYIGRGEENRLLEATESLSDFTVGALVAPASTAAYQRIKARRPRPRSPRLSATDAAAPG